MQKTNLALVSLLSLLVVVAPAASALAQTQNMEEAVETNEKEQSSQKSEARGGVFDEIEKKGAKPVSDKKLDEKKGEGFLAGLAASAIGAGVGAVSAGVGYAVSHAISGNSMSWRGAAAAVGGGFAAGATSGALMYAAPTP